ncbi:GIY-YIG domain-containing protein [Pararobbsia alpina]|uniref:hypothetical protein n=1 Tax=Pararobbsia alpina TaxID=621374 RepID=UPI0039A4BFF1
MFMTSEGDKLELAPWRMRRFVRLLAEANRYPPDTPPHVLMQDLRALIARARRVPTEPRLGTARFTSTGPCCNACLLASLRRGVLELLGLSIDASRKRSPSTGFAGPHRQLPSPIAPRHAYHGAPGFTSQPGSSQQPAVVELRWRRWPTLAVAAAYARGPGVYILVRNGHPVYVGKSASLRHRLAQHQRNAQIRRDNGLTAWVASAPASLLETIQNAAIGALRGHISNDPRRATLVTDAGGPAMTQLLPSALSARTGPIPRRRAAATGRSR